MKTTLARTVAALTLTLALAACGDQAPAEAPAADDAKAPLDTLEEETDGSTNAEGDPSVSINSDGQMVGGSNDDASARKPDPKRSKLIKADPD